MNVTAAVSVVAVPSVTTIIGAIAGADGMAVRLVTLLAGVELVKTRFAPEEAPVLQAAEVPFVNEPPVRLPKNFGSRKVINCPAVKNLLKIAHKLHLVNAQYILTINLFIVHFFMIFSRTLYGY